MTSMVVDDRKLLNVKFFKLLIEDVTEYSWDR